MKKRSMPRLIHYAIMIFLLYAGPSFADTTVSGRISADTTWTPANSPYLVTSTVQVYGTSTTPVTLTIQPGVLVKFNSGAGLQIGDGTNQGSLVSQGTATNHITFTRSGASGTWAGMTFNDKTVDSTTIIEYADIQYSTGIVMNSASPTIKNSAITNVTGYGMNLSSSNPSLQNVTVSSTNNSGLYLSSSNPVLDAVTVQANGTYGITLTASNPTITGGSLTNTNTAGYGIYGTGSPVISNYSVSIVNTQNKYGIFLATATSALSITNSTIANSLYINSTGLTPTITGNTFTNVDSSPIHAGANIISTILNNNTINGMTSAGKIEVVGEQITQDTHWTIWPAPYVVVYSSVSVYKDATTAATLTIDPGALVKFNASTGLQIGNGTSKGALVAQGTAGNHIKFTRSGTSGTWSGINFQDGTIDSTTNLEYADVQYSTGIVMNYASPAIRNSTITDVAGYGLNLTYSNPTIDTVTIANNGTSGINLSSSSPTITNGSLTNSSANGYGIYGSGSPVISNVTVSNVAATGYYGISLGSSTSGLSITNSTISNGLSVTAAGIVPVITGNTISNFDQFPLHAGANYIGQILNNNTFTGMTSAGRIEVVADTISQDALWKKWDAPYVILGAVIVAKDTTTASTLTIEAGTTLKFVDGPTSLQIGTSSNKGALTAVGTAANKILFTSNSAAPAPGKWSGLYLYRAGANASVIQNAIIEYGGYNCTAFSCSDIYISYDAAPIIRNSTIRNSSGSGINIAGDTAAPQIDSCTITGNKWGIYSTGSNPAVTNSIVTGNTTAGVTNGSTSPLVDARNCWWGSATGPTVASNPTGTGSIVSSYVTYSPWLTQEPGTSSVVISDTQAAPGSLNPDGDSTAISATISEPADWTIVITDSNNNQVRHLSGTGTTVSARWYGENDQSQKVADGGYYYVINAVSTAWGVPASSPQGLIVVSRDLPVAIFTQPLDNQMFATGSLINVTGTAADSTDFQYYTLEYGAGASPSTWTSLKTSGTTTTNGSLYSWDTSSLTGSVYTLRLKVYDTHGNVATETALVRLLGNQNPAASEAYISPNNDGVKDASTVTASITYNSNWTISVKNGSNQTVRSFTGAGTSVNQTWDGKNTAGQVVPDGSYTWQVDAVSTETGVAALPKTGSIIVDTTLPTAQITAPSSNALVRNTAPVTGTAADANFNDYRIEYGPASGAGPWSTVTTATTAVSGGALATWVTNDQTNSVLLQNGDYALRLTATDKAGNSATASVPVSADNLILSNVSISSNSIDTFASQSSSIFYTINSAATVTLKIIPENQGPTGAPIYQTSQNMTAAGASSFTWSGQNAAGAVVPDEAYLYVLEASDGTKTDSYSPSQPSGTGSVVCSQSSDFDPLTNRPMTITYTPSLPSRVTLSISWGAQNFNVLTASPAMPVSRDYIWDVRNPSGQPLDIGAAATCSVASLLRENYIITTGDTPAISEIKTDPYAVSLSYGQFTRIKYTLLRGSLVTIQILSPSGASATILSNQPQSAGPQEYMWNGLDTVDPSGKKMLISEEGDYLVTIQAVNPASGTSTTVRGSLKILN